MPYAASLRILKKREEASRTGDAGDWRAGHALRTLCAPPLILSAECCTYMLGLNGSEPTRPLRASGLGCPGVHEPQTY